MQIEDICKNKRWPGVPESRHSWNIAANSFVCTQLDQANGSFWIESSKGRVERAATPQM